MPDLIRKDDVLDILEETRQLVNMNWGGDEVLLDMIIVIRDKIMKLKAEERND